MGEFLGQDDVKTWFNIGKVVAAIVSIAVGLIILSAIISNRIT